MATEPAPREPDTVRLELPASYKYLNVLAACVAEMLAHVEGTDEAGLLASKVQLAVQEVCTNIVKHAYAGRPGGRISGTLTLAAAPRRLVVELLDTGGPFDLASVRAPDLSEGHEGGYGLFLVRALMDEVTYARDDGRNRWRLVKQV